MRYVDLHSISKDDQLTVLSSRTYSLRRSTWLR